MDCVIWISFIVLIQVKFNFYQNIYRQALHNFERCVKPGGLLLIDHRNYEYIIQKGQTSPIESMYYNVSNKLFNISYAFDNHFIGTSLTLHQQLIS